MPRLQFMAGAASTYSTLCVGVAMLARTPAELTADFKKLNDGQLEGQVVIDMIKCIREAKDWLEGFGKVLGTIEARAWAAASRLAAEGVA